MYRRNLDIFTEDFLEIPLKFFQKQLLLGLAENEVEDVMASRGLSKSFMVFIFATDMALLYSNQEILITSFTLNQSNNIIEEKIDKELSNPKSGISPILRQLRIDGWMEIKKDQNTGAKYIEFGNGSKIFAVNCGDSCRGKRSTIVITDECVLIKKKDYQEIVEPTLRPRQFKGRPSDYKEETKQIFLSSAKTKTNWMWRHLRTCVNEHYKNKRIKHGFFAGDIFTAVASGIQSPNQYIQRKKITDDMSFEQEYLNIFLGSNENSLFKYEDFDRNRTLENPFYPREPYEVLDGVKNTYNFENEDWIRILVCDIAVATGNENDNTVYIFLAINKKTGQRRLENIITKNGLNSITQVMYMKRWFYEYKATYFMQDTKGIGNTIFDLLTVETYDNETGEIYPAWTVCKDKALQITSDTVMTDKVTRTLDSNAVEVVIPYAGTSELNSQMHLLLRKTLRDEKIDLLKDDGEMKAIIEEKDPKFILKSSEEKALTMLPFLETRYTINEAISLEVKFLDSGFLKVQEEKRTDTKDRYMTLAMANFLAEKIYNKYNNDSYEEEDIDLEDWQWLKG